MHLKQQIIKELEDKLIALEDEYINLELEVDKEELLYRLTLYIIDTYKIDTNLL